MRQQVVLKIVQTRKKAPYNSSIRSCKNVTRMDRVKSESNVHEFTGLLSTQTQSRVYETYQNAVTGMDSLRTADAFPVVASLSQAKEWIAACQDQRFTTKTRKFLSVWTVVILTE